MCTGVPHLTGEAFMPKHAEASTHRAGIGLIEVSPTTWQVRGPGMGVGSTPVLLGFIQYFGDIYEVMDLRRPMERTYLSSLDQAVASVTEGMVRA